MSEQACRAVAVVGFGAVLPDAPDASTFWQNIKRGQSCISDVTPDRWDPDDYYDPNPSVPDKTYSKIGGWVRGFTFDPLKLHIPIPPKVLKGMDEGQHWAIVCCRAALLDYGYPDRPLDASRTAVILGNTMAGENHYITAWRICLPEYCHMLEALPEFNDLPPDIRKAILDGIRNEVYRRSMAITEDTLPGELANIIAGRVANLYDLCGPNFVVDAACASSFAALQTAVDGLIARRFDTVLTGGIDRDMSAPVFVKFSKIGALSPDGSRPYSEGASGFVMAEGAAVFLLKRLQDAERDGDAIYAVIRGSGSSSDGRGKGITAPNPIGQQRAIERAWQSAGLGPETATYIEGHGTSTPVGDVVEVAVLGRVFSAFDLPRASIALGSVKSNIGHLKGAAGAAGLLKTVYALQEKVLPPTINFCRPNPKIDFDSLPFYVNTELRPWDRPSCGVRRAGVSSFGFGGTNFHVVVEEYIPGMLTRDHAIFQGVQIGHDKENREATTGKAPYRGALVLGASNVRDLQARLKAVLARVRAGNLPLYRPPTTTDLLASERLAVDYGSAEELLERGDDAYHALEFSTPSAWKLLASRGTFRGRGKSGKVAFLFPGQGSQYVNMLRELRDIDPVVADTFCEADEVMAPLLGRQLTSYVFAGPTGDKYPTTGDRVAAAEAELRNTQITQPAVLAVDIAMARLLASYGSTPDLVAGHSLGEYAALVVAGVLSFADALRIVSLRGREASKASMRDRGSMAAIFAPLAEVERILSNVEGYVDLANINSRNQVVIGGESTAIDRAVTLFETAGYRTARIPVSQAFHTRLVASTREPLRRALAGADIRPPRLPIVANVTGEMYPGDRDQIIDLLVRQVTSQVQFVKGIETLYHQGVRVFVEVGPKRALTTFVGDILSDRADVTTLFTNHPKKGDIPSLNEALCRLYAAGAVATHSESTLSKEGQKTLEPVSLSSRVTQLQTDQIVHADSVLDEPAPEGLVQRMANPETGTDPVASTVLALVSEKTGYPPRALDLNFDLEADLGIDSIKQADIFTAILQAYQIPRRKGLRLSDYNTLAKVVAFVRKTCEAQERVSDAAALGARPSLSDKVKESERKGESLPPVADLDVAGDLPRRVPVPVLRPSLKFCKSTGVAFGPDSRVVIVSDSGPVGRWLRSRLCACKVKLLSLEETTLQAAQTQIEEWLSEGAIAGVYFLPALDQEPALGEMDLPRWHSEQCKRVKTLFTVMRAIPGNVFLVCGTRMGGLHGYGSEGAINPLGGSVTGFAKAYAMERPGVLVKAVDVDADAEEREIAEHLVNETLWDPGSVEIGYHCGQRFGVELIERSLDGATHDVELDRETVFLITGGAGGIVAPVIADLARASAGTFHLTGRTPLPDPDDHELVRLKEGREVLKRDMERQILAAGERPTPVKIERRLAAVERKASILSVMEEVECAGGKAHYHSCDVMDADSVSALVGHIKQVHGHIDVLIHAAGIERSHVLPDKEPEEFDLVFGVKADGLFNLLKAAEMLDHPPRAVVTFCSVAGRFGNAGQTDYSAANDLLCKMTSSLRTTHPQTKAVAIDWSAWKGIGMASRGSVPEMMRRAGIQMLDPKDAAPVVHRELVANSKGGEVVIAHSLGVLLSPRDPEGGLDLVSTNAHIGTALAMVDRATGIDAQGRVTFEAKLDPRSEPFLYDHMLEGTPLLPGVMGVEGFAEVANLIAWSLNSAERRFRIVAIEDVHFEKPLKFYRQEPRTLTWRARTIPEGSSLVTHVELESFHPVKSEQVSRHTRYFSGRICQEPLHQGVADLQNPIAHAPRWSNTSTIEAGTIYRAYFHGPAFRVLEGVQIGEDLVVGRLSLDLPPLVSHSKQILTTPHLIESCMQTAGVWQVVKTGALAWPTGMQRIVIHRSQRNGTPLYAQVTPSLGRNGRFCFDACVVDERGYVYLEMEGYRTTNLLELTGYIV